jgi:hypothetical protein
MSNATIASLIESHKDRLIEDWSRVVRDDPRISSDAQLSKPELIDHIPTIIDEICDLIRRGETPGVHNTHEARASVYTRIRQGYSGRDLIRELSLLRLTLLGHLTDLALDEALGLKLEDRDEAARIINQYLDEEMRYAISVFGDSGLP